MPSHRNRRNGRSTLWVAALAAVAVHVAVLGTVHALGITLVPAKRITGPTQAKPVVDDIDLQPTCAGDVVLATSGRTALCFAPWVASVDDCLADAQMSLWMDLSSCDAQKDPETAISMVESRTTNRLREIDPERLLEDAKRPPTPTPPPPPPPQAAAAPPPPPPPSQRANQQVVETVKPAEEKEAPDNARFLSEFNTRTDKETVSRGARNEPMVAKAKPESFKATDKPAEASTRQQSDHVGENVKAPDAPGKLSMRAPGALAPAPSEQEAKAPGTFDGAKGATSDDGYRAHKGEGSIAQQRRDRTEQAPGQNGGGGGAPDALLKPSQDVLQRALGGGSVDKLDNVADGDETSLNSKKWIYASFFNRLKRQVAQNWDPQSVWRRADPRGTVYGIKNRVTEVRVSLSRTGEIQNILVTEASGVMALDEEAVRAFRASGPFPNPPDGLVKDNQITFTFGFYFGVGAPRTSWRMPTAM